MPKLTKKAIRSVPDGRTDPNYRKSLLLITLLCFYVYEFLFHSSTDMAQPEDPESLIIILK